MGSAWQHGPICVKCGREMHCTKNDILIHAPGRRALLPYGSCPPDYHCGDMYECPECETQVIVGLGQQLDITTLQDHRRLLAWYGEGMEFRQ